ncbi:DASS family sodium-coupled anion symporter [Campylobacter jejuni]|nr:DASS family sodium-coupled anion symporter [Campylobacter jejuni]EJD3102524.1 DASS family sodium-coupled anion symporter [Campylobacter jejuni]EJO1483411.1 DASS family sodium-coupled anion symporter [Campylobacter jejuni]HDZ4960394.1 DASS family sodium-coupled anion symporter [Campylobacter jejuni]
MSNSIKTFIIVADIILFIALLALLPFETKVNQGLAILAFIAVLWLSEALHVTITAILIPILAVIMGLMPTKSALHGFADPNIFLFFGGFALAAAMHFQELDKIIAQRILMLARGNFALAALYIFFTTAFLSMWMSNTATAAMMLPLAIGMLSQLDYEENKNTYVFVLLGIAFSASIGGIGTLVGTPPNAIVATNLNITFAQWLQYGIPIVIIFMPLMILVLYVTFKPNLKFQINTDLEQKIPMDTQKYITLIIFAIVAMCWIFSSYINSFVSNLLGFEKKIANFDSVIAILAAVLVCTFRVVSWKKVQENTDWGVLMLFGGGITLSLVLKDSGASKIMADGIISLIAGGHLFLIGLLVSLFIVFLTEFTSNTASAALLVPLFISMAESLGAPSLGLALIIGIGASCAFMLPVATPPNAIVFGTGYIKQSQMVRVGIYLNVLCSIIIALMAYFFWL